MRYPCCQRGRYAPENGCGEIGADFKYQQPQTFTPRAFGCAAKVVSNFSGRTAEAA